MSSERGWERVTSRIPRQRESDDFGWKKPDRSRVLWLNFIQCGRRRRTRRYSTTSSPLLHNTAEALSIVLDGMKSVCMVHDVAGQGLLVNLEDVPCDPLEGRVELIHATLLYSMRNKHRKDAFCMTSLSMKPWDTFWGGHVQWGLQGHTYMFLLVDAVSQME